MTYVRELLPMGWQSFLFRTLGTFIILSERNEYVSLMFLYLSSFFTYLSVEDQLERAKKHTVLTDLSIYVF